MLPAALRKCRAGPVRCLSGMACRDSGCPVPGDREEVPGLQREEASLYVHWPYCLRRCSYCNFNKYISRSVNHVAMATCLQRETETLLRLSRVSRITSVFFGGGTPSLAPPSTIAAVLETVARHAGLQDDAEVTLEVNPTPVGVAKLEDFHQAGVNRFSIGVQSLRDEDLRILGRDHNSQHALRTLEEAQRLCPGHVSVDVIFGRPGQSVESWERELEELLLVCDDHVSLYQLTLERGTHLFKQGAVSSHNLGYWKAGQYLGVGPGAHGRFVPRGGGVWREARTQTLEPDVWMREVQRWGHGTRRRVELIPAALLEEVLVMGLRLTEGISHQHWRRFSPGLELEQLLGCAELQELQERGLLILDTRGLRCSWEGLAVLDSLLPLCSWSF